MRVDVSQYVVQNITKRCHHSFNSKIKIQLSGYVN